MRRKLLTALALVFLICALASAEAATVKTTGAFDTEINMIVEPQFAYQISSSDLTFSYGDEAQTLTLTLTDRVLYPGDMVRVTAPLSVTLTDAETGHTLPVNFLPAEAEETPEGEPAQENEPVQAGETAQEDEPVQAGETVQENETVQEGEAVPEGESDVYDFDEAGVLNLSVSPDWTDAKSGVYAGEAILALAVESNSGFDYEGTAARRVEIALPLTVNVDYCTVTVLVGEGGTIKLTEDGEPLETDDEHRYEFALGRSETAALWLVPDEGYAVGEVLIDPDEEWVTREDDRLIFTEIQADTTVTLTFVPNIVSIGLDANLIELSPDGETEHQLSATIAPDAAQGSPVTWTSSDADVAAVDDTGLVFISESGDCGSAIIRCASPSDADVYAECAVVVHSSRRMVLPAAIRVIEEEAFAGTAATEFILPDGIERIEERAFAQSNAKLVKIMNKQIVLDDRAFEGCEDVTLFCPSGSSVEEFAESHHLRCILYDEP